MKLKELYKKVRREQEVSLDEDSMWDAIESRLEKPKKKRRFIWLWFTMMGILLIGAYFHFMQDHESLQVNNFSTKNVSKNTSPVNTTPVLTPLILDNNTLKANKDGESIQNHNELTTIDNSNTITDLKSYESMDVSVFKDEDHESKRSTIIGITLQKEAYDGIETSSVSSIAYGRQSAINSMGDIGHILKIASVPTLSYSKIENENFEIRFASLSVIPSLTKFTDIDKKDDVDKKHKLELDVSLHFLQTSNATVEKDPLVTSWSELHKKSKSSSMSFQFSTILKYRHQSGIGIGSGIIARQVSEWYDATVETKTPYSMPSDSAKFVTVNGIKTFTKGVLTGTKIERTNYHTPIRRLYIDIPLEVSYSRSWNRMEAELLMSYNLNVSHQYFGRSYAEDKILLDQDQLNLQGIYNSNFVNSTNIGLKLNHHLTSNVSIGISLNYWLQLSSSLDSSSSVSEHYQGFGGGLNIRRSFID